MNIISMIKDTDPHTCSSFLFLDTLQWIENINHDITDKHDLSPVFLPPSEPSRAPINRTIMIDCYYDKDDFLSNKSRVKNQTNYNGLKSFKNQNQHFRKMGYLKQPGGASCNQRR